MISVLKRLANSIAAAVLPVAVAPPRIMTVLRVERLIG